MMPGISIHTIRKIHNDGLGHHVSYGLDKSLVGGISRDVVVPVLDRLKLDNKAMSDAVLGRLSTKSAFKNTPMVQSAVII